jgi:adenylate cyclase
MGTTTSATLVNQVANWLMAQALEDTDLESVVMGCCERLQASGIPIYRGYFAFTVLHPLYRAMGFTWTRGKGVVVKGYPHVPGGQSDQFSDSPHGYMMNRKLDHLRVRLESDRGMQFPVFDGLRRDGATDYLAFVATFTPGRADGMLGSWTTDQRDGFTDSEVEALMRIQDRLAVACKMAVRFALTRNVLGTYLGTNAGDRVLDGQIHRGDGESIEAAIWYSDLRGSTVMADTLPRQDYIDALNAYFDAAGGAVVDSGGEILSFIGDALLAIFPAKPHIKGAAKSCSKAIGATKDAFARMQDINELRSKSSQTPLQFGVGLHRGEVMFGNVGVPERLTFSVFGSAVNEVVRIEKLTSQLNEPVLVSDRFAEAVDTDWRALGQHPLRGVERDIPIYAPTPVDAAARERATA